MDIILRLLIVLFLIFLNGFFVASEFALVSVRKTRVDELVKKGNRSAKLIQRALKNINAIISATQLGVTLASLALGWIGEPVIADAIMPLLSFLPSDITWLSVHTVSISIAFVLITYLHIVLGELTPKTIALQKAENVALFIIAPLIAFLTILKPFIRVLNISGRLVLRILHFESSTHEGVHSEDEIKMLLRESGQSGVIPQKEIEMVTNVFKLGEIPVRYIMMPRTDIIAFNKTATLPDVVQMMNTNVHSRFPVYEQTIDTIIGFVHIKDIYKVALVEKERKRLIDLEILREIINVPETKKADEVLREMRKKRVHMAVVNDEYGGTAGIVTLEDVIESLVGEIQDEFEKPFSDIQKLSDDSYLFDSRVSIDQVQRKFNIPLRGQGYATIGGLVFGLLGREPKVSDTVQIGDICFEVEQMHKKRIEKIKIYKNKNR